MKQLKKVAVAILLFVAATSYVQAQSKVAHIDVSELLSQMPEMNAAQAELKKLEETYRADIQGSVEAYRNKLTQYNNEANSMSQEENQKRALELQGFERNIGEAQQAAQQELAQKQAELFEPISKKAKDAIEKVAAAQGYDYVMDASPGSGVIVAKGKDLLPDVKKELGF
ncbi:OmpH family outer membrane protein [Robiginitalea marina]|uniref:OmpH family outer membrane protein n=1 Tax=Robiginitalea marina TaxID=2954105 RepID=A0ABT1AZA4_9FLAO|nr:OmpH family outer membrane protein [Robiginitalea marina]MCO5724688.1 OmpH family outer membrane protein [Robiginitalea marina]